MKRKVSFYTLGCRLNQSETAVIENTFRHDGHNVVDFNTPADVAVINTCTVTENGDADTRRLVNKVVRTNPNVRIALVGCQAQVQKEQLMTLPNVRWVVGNARKMDFVSILNEWNGDDDPEVIAPTIDRDSFVIPTAGIDQSRTRANIKIQDGCDFFCSFCEIPYARGRARSREFGDILVECNALVAAGHKEIVITGINVGTYQNANKTILDVVEALEQIQGLERIRISSIEPTTIPQALIKKMAGKTKLCRYVHIPLQSGTTEMLNAMKRKYTIEEFADFVNMVRDTAPDACIGTDVIVGFPGESKELFQRTEDYLRESPIHYFHVFSYSKRQMAKSQHLAEEVDIKEIQHRSQILRELSQRKRHVFYEKTLGTTQKVLFEQNKDGLWNGLTDHYIRVKAPSKTDLTNQLVDVTIEHNHGTWVEGQITHA